MLESITNFVDGLINSLIRVPTQFIGYAASNEWDKAFESLFSQGGLTIAIILLVLVFFMRRESNI